MNPIKAIYCRTVQAVLNASLTCSLPPHLTSTTGMDAYHGKEGFDAFSHKKSIADKKRGWICPCVTSPTVANSISFCCTCF